MELFAPTKVRIVVNPTAGGEKITLATAPEIYIKRPSDGKFWDDSVPEFTVTKTALTMVQDSDLDYWYYSDADLVDLNSFDYNIISTDAANPFDIIGQFRITTAFDDLTPASMCKVVLYASDQDSSCPMESDTLLKDAYAKLTVAYVDTAGRYYSTEKRQPSFIASTGEVAWTLPQGSTVEFSVPALGIESTKAKTIPAESTKLHKDLVDA